MRVDDVAGLTVGMPKRVQHLHLEYGPVSIIVTAHHHHCLSDLFRAVVGKHGNDISAGWVGTGEGSNAFILVEKCRHVRAKKDRRA